MEMIEKNEFDRLLHCNKMIHFPNEILNSIFCLCDPVCLLEVMLCCKRFCDQAKFSFTFLRPISLVNPCSANSELIKTIADSSAYRLTNIVISSSINVMTKDVFVLIARRCPNLRRLELLFTKEKRKLRHSIARASPVSSSLLKPRKSVSNSNPSLQLIEKNAVYCTPIKPSKRHSLDSSSKSFITPVNSCFAHPNSDPRDSYFHRVRLTASVRKSKVKSIRRLPSLDFSESFPEKTALATFSTDIVQDFIVKRNRNIDAEQAKQLILQIRDSCSFISIFTIFCTSIISDVIFSFKHLAQLKELIFWGVHRKYELNDVVKFVNSCKSVSKIVVRSNNISSKTFSHLSLCPNLESFCIEQTKVCENFEESLINLITSSHNWSHLELTNVPNVSSVGVQSLCQNRRKSNWKILSLSISDGIDDEILSELGKLEQLEILKLHVRK